MKFQIKKGEQSVILNVFIQDSSSTTGAGLSGLDESSLITGGYVKRNNVGVALAVDENVTTEGTYQSPSAAGKVRIGTVANMPVGNYELHLHNDLFTTEDWLTIGLSGATNMATLELEVQLTNLDMNTGMFAGITSVSDWLRAIARSDTADSTALSEINAGGGTYDEATDSQEAIADSVVAAAPLLYPPDASSLVVTGTEGGSFADASSVNATYWTATDTGTGIEMIAEINMGSGRVAQSLSVTGRFDSGGGRIVEFYYFDYTLSSYVKLSDGTAEREMRNSASDKSYLLSLPQSATDSATIPGEVKIKFLSAQSNNTDVLYLDLVEVSGVASGATSPEAIADAISVSAWGESLNHIPKFTGEVRYIAGTAGDDANSGLYPEAGLATILDWFTNASAGDYGKIFADIFAEAVVLNKDGLELHGEIGATITGNGGVPLTISADNCRIDELILTPAAGQKGLVITGDGNHIEILRISGGITSVEITGTGNQIGRVIATEYTATAFDIKNTTVIHDCVASSSQASTRGYYLSNTLADRTVLRRCISNSNDTAGYEIVTGVTNAMFDSCAESEACGTRIDTGTDTSWRDHKVSDGAILAAAQGPVTFTGATNEAGLTLIGQGAGAGLQITAGATGNGLDATGGSTSGDGIRGSAGAFGVGHGMSLTGSVSGDGLNLAANGSGVTNADLDGIVTTLGDAGAGLTDLGGMSTAMKDEVNAEVLNGLDASGLILQKTTIATLASQTSFTLTDGSADDDSYINQTAIIIDQTTGTQKVVSSVSDYAGGTKTITLAKDPGVFTMAVGDTVVIATSSAITTLNAVLSGDTFNVMNSLAKRLRDLGSSVVHTGTAAGSGTGPNQIQFDGSASSTDGAYDPAMVTIIDGTGQGQTRLIYQYDGTTKIATVDRNWKIAPDTTSEFVILAHPGREHVNEGLAQGGTNTTITLNALASSNNDAYRGQAVFVRSGTGEDQVRSISSYNGTSKVAIIDRPWAVIPDTTSAYVMLPQRYVSEIVAGTVDNALTDATTTTFKTNLTFADTVFNDQLIHFTSGLNVNMTIPVSSYTQTNGAIILEEPLRTAPADGDTFVMIADHVHPIDQIVQGVWDFDVTGTGVGATLAGNVINGIKTVLSGITFLKNWLGLGFAKHTGDSTARAELNATGAGSGDFDETTDSLEANRNNIGTNGVALNDLGGMSTAMKTQVATSVWDASLSSHNILNSFGIEVKNISEDTATTIPTLIATSQADLDIITGADGVILLSGTQASIDAIETDTDTTIPALITGLNNISVSDILATPLTESYAADGAEFTLEQALYQLNSSLSEFSISGVTITTKKLDGISTAMTFTLDDNTNPTSRTRTS